MKEEMGKMGGGALAGEGTIKKENEEERKINTKNIWKIHKESFLLM